MRLNLSWVTPRLAVGGRYPMEAAAHLARKLGIRRVVDVRVECKDDEEVLREHEVLLLHLPTEDGRAIAQELITDGVRWVNEQLDQGARVYIHCEHGVGRSALLALCVLVSRGHEPLSALELAKNAREQVSPSPEQLDAYLSWCAAFRAENGHEWPLPTLEEVMSIAYRHLRGREGEEA